LKERLKWKKYSSMSAGQRGKTYRHQPLRKVSFPPPEMPIRHRIVQTGHGGAGTDLGGRRCLKSKELIMCDPVA
jgi:hypothetical protein